MLNVPATFHQSIGIHYFNVKKSGFLLDVRLDAGHDKYRAIIDYPFKEYGFKEPASKDDYRMQKTISYVSLGGLLGYRFKNIGRFIPEIYYSQIIALPLDYSRFTENVYAETLAGKSSIALSRDGSFGKRSNDNVLRFSNIFFVGVTCKDKSVFSRYSAGLQYEHQLFTIGYPQNYLEVFYKDANDFGVVPHYG